MMASINSFFVYNETRLSSSSVPSFCMVSLATGLRSLLDISNNPSDTTLRSCVSWFPACAQHVK